MYKLVIPLILIFSSNLIGQDILNQKWFKKVEWKCDSIDNESQGKNERWDFSNPNQFVIEIFKNQGAGLPQRFNYKIEKNKIVGDFASYEIISKTEKELILKGGTDALCRTMKFASESAYEDEQLNQFTMSGEDTLYIPLLGKGPILSEVKNFNQYFESEILKKFLRNGVDCKMSYRFIIKKDGTLSILKVKGCSEKSEKKLTKLLTKTYGKWKPMMIHGKPVDSFIQHKFRLNAKVLR